MDCPKYTPCAATCERRSRNTSMREVVVLLHGLGRTPLSMLALAAGARRRGYRVINWHYLSTCSTIAAHAAAFARDVAPRLASAPRVHFITHSLGGIVVRQFLNTHALPNLGRVVMLAPPNGGSEVADVLRRWVPQARELGTDEASVPRSLPCADFALGVIAGSRSHIPLFARWMRSVPNDGVVAVERTRLEGMIDFVVLPRTHTTLPWSRDAIEEAFRFVAEGRFSGSRR